jgi:hypothetical protein
MAQNPPRTFSGITPDQYAQLIVKTKASGLELSGNNGTASKLGVEVQWNYSPDSQQLTVQCLRTPMFVSAATVYGRIQALVEESTVKL